MPESRFEQQREVAMTFEVMGTASGLRRWRLKAGTGSTVTSWGRVVLRSRSAAWLRGLSPIRNQDGASASDSSTVIAADGWIGIGSPMMAQIDVPVGSVPEGWGHARLIPTFGIRSQQEQEKRATSCLLAVMHGVPEFGHALLKELDAPKAPTIETFAEVRFKDAERQDGDPRWCDRVPAGQEDVDVLGRGQDRIGAAQGRAGLRVP